MVVIPILLTATVDPQGMRGAEFSVEQRVAQYVEAIRFYATRVQSRKKVQMRIVFAENSGHIDDVKKKLAGMDLDVEWIDAAGSEYDQKRGKGYNETLLIQKAIEQSITIREAGCFFKVTGRLKLMNIDRLVCECLLKQPSQPLTFDFRADCKDHDVYRWLHLPINGHAGECRYWFATTTFFQTEMLPYLDRLNDYAPNVCLAEDAMLEVCRATRGRAYCCDRFRTQARLSGVGGHALGKGIGFFYSTDNDSFALRLKSTLHQLLRWLLPWWRC
jgi:hypothetical protein